MCQRELTELFAELTEFAVVLSEFSLPKHPDLPILVFFRFPRFFFFFGFPCFFVLFSSLFLGFQGFCGEENPCFFRGILEQLVSETGRIWFRRVRFQTPTSVSFFALTELWGENSVSSSQPIICLQKRTHRFFVGTDRVCPKTQ